MNNGRMNTQRPTCVKTSLSLLISLIPFAGIAAAQEDPPVESPIAVELPEYPLLKVGEVLEGEITQDDPAVETEILKKGYTQARTRGKTFGIRVEETGPYHIDLRSYFFDAYLVLRDQSGAVIAEDDDGLLSTHARIVAELEAGGSYQVEASALHGQTGRFEIVFLEGHCEEPSPVEKARLGIEDAREAIRWVEALRGPDHPDVADSLSQPVVLLYSQGLQSEARPLSERSLRIREKALGSDHPDVAMSLDNLGAILHSQGFDSEARPLHERSVGILEKALGPDHPDVATSLGNLALLLQSQGRFFEARSHFERALAINEKALGPDHHLTGASLNNLAVLLKAQGFLDEARPLYERALAIDEKVLGPDHHSTATSLNNLAVLLIALGSFDEARPLFERALAIREKVLGPDHPDTAITLNNMADFLKSQGLFEEARPLYSRALSIREKVLGPDHPDTAMSLDRLGILRKSQGFLDEARPLIERALAIREKVYGPDHHSTATSLNNLATLLLEQGLLTEARPLFERARSICEEVFGPNHPITARSLSNLAHLLERQGYFEEARPLYEGAIEIHTKVFGPDHPDTALDVDGLAGLLMGQGLFEQARSLYEQALERIEKSFGPGHPSTAISVGNLAVLLEKQGLFEEARPLHERAIAICEEALGPDHPETASSLHNLAALLASQGLLEEARPLYKRVLAIDQKVFGPDHPATATSLCNFANLLVSQGVFEEARPIQERALSIRENVLGFDHPSTAMSLNSLARLEVDLGNSNLALSYARRALASSEGHIERILGALTESERIRFLRGIFVKLEVFLSLSRIAVESLPEGEVHSALLRWKGRVFRSLLTRGCAGRTVAVDEKRLLDRLRGTQQRLSDVFYAPAVEENVQGVRQEKLVHLQALRNDLELELSRMRAQRIHHSKSEGGGDFREALSLLDSEAVAVDFFVHRVYQPAQLQGSKVKKEGEWSSLQLTAWVVDSRKGGAGTIRVDLGDAARMEEAVSVFLDELVMTRGLAPVQEEKGRKTTANDTLRKLLWEPLKDRIGDTAIVIVSPDSFVGTLPFETLQLEDGRYLVEKHSFVYLHDLLGLFKLSKNHGVPGKDDRSLLVAGGVDYRRRDDSPRDLVASASAAASTDGDATRGSYRSIWRPLSATRDEAEAIADVHDETFGEKPKRLLLSKKAATEERIKKEVPAVRYVHLATHGYFQPEGLPSMWKNAVVAGRGPGVIEMRETERVLTGLHPGLLSGLVFAGANMDSEPGRDNGLLTAEEVTYLDLSNCDLVVLSACETGLGRPESGEGMIGLRRSFRIAGASTVISSLWSVKDEATSDLMTMFYENLWLNKMGKLEALRTAQLEMLKRNRAEYGEGLPSTWGAFVLDGDWR